MQLPRYRWRFAHLAALCVGHGVAQPVFSMLKSNPEFLVVQRSTRADAGLFAVLIVVVPPLVILGAEAPISIAFRAARCTWSPSGRSRSSRTVLKLVRLLDPERRAALLLPMFPARLLALAYMKWSVFRAFLSVSFALPVLARVTAGPTRP
jgi:hypothetical protein